MPTKTMAAPQAIIVVFLFLLSPSYLLATTDQADVQALQVVYTSLNSPSQLTGWKSTGGDPCAESWKGIACQGSSVVAIQVPGLGLSGTMGYSISNLLSLSTLDLSNNDFKYDVPYQLPSNLTSINLAQNNFTGSLPYSISAMGSLSYLNVSHNSFSQPIAAIFTGNKRLSALDLSFNNFSGEFSSSFSSFSNLSKLYLQNNRLTGSIDILSALPLTELNIANNQFNGSIPQNISSIPNFLYDGNSFNNSDSPLVPRYASPPPIGPRTGTDANTTQASQPAHKKNKGSKTGLIIGIVLGIALVALCALLVVVCYLRKFSKGKTQSKSSASKTLAVSDHKVVNRDMQKQSVQNVTAVADLKLPPAENSMDERVQRGSVSGIKPKTPIAATSHTIASLQTATNSFSQEFLVGEGSFGRVYRAEYPDGKVLAVKKLDSAAVALQDVDNFLEVVSNMSRLRHPNVVSLIGYCAEHGQRLLVYEYVEGGTLHEILHFNEYSNKRLSWNARVKVALGTARALEYLHEVCSPSIVHRNFKSANILLDEELNPHLSDSGIAALTTNAERTVSTQMVGSFGYSAPEFSMSGIYTVKSDVYSFGVVMLELLTGRKPLDSSRVRSEQSLVRWATPQLHDIDSLAKMVDPALNAMYPAKSLSRFADIIAQCIQAEPEFRPPMSEVVESLVRLVQRASMVKRSSDESGFAFRGPEHDTRSESLGE
ncbi:Protein STRUBBELIG-REPTOR FAMILY 8 [Ranunculus cassubicifolius]